MQDYEWEWRREGVTVDRALTVSLVYVRTRKGQSMGRVNARTACDTLVGGAGLGDGG